MSKSLLLALEDYWSIWIAGFLLVIGVLLFFNNKPSNLEIELEQLESILQYENDRASFKTVEWYDAFDDLKNKKASSFPIGKLLSKVTAKPGTWTSNPIDAFYKSQQDIIAHSKAYKAKLEFIINKESESKENALSKQYFATTPNFQDSNLNNSAEKAINDWRAVKEEMLGIKKQASQKKINLLPWLLLLMFLLGSLFAFGSKVMGRSAKAFYKGFTFVFIIGIISYLLGAQSDMKLIGFGYAAWAIILGLLISNTLGTPDWVKPALTTEFYIKTGLVILGAEILFGKILAIGLPGIFVAWIVTPVVLVSTFWFGQKVVKIGSKTLNMTISADMSVCGVSAAVATAAACKASKEELTVAIGLSMIFTSVMMIVMPAFINYMGMPEILGGAWIGGTIDATGAVVAAGAFLGEKALSVAATIKMIQNILIGIIAFGVAIYFATKVNQDDVSDVGWGEIWRRFPKFILGFIGASIIFSIIYALLGTNLAYTMIDQGVIGAFTKNIRGWLFCLAFVSIGLSINFNDLKKHFIGGKPLILYICGQTLNLCLTLLMAYIMFYHVFPHITENI